MKIVIVGFNVKQTKSLLYEQLTFKELSFDFDQSDDSSYSSAIGKVILRCMVKGCDFVSVRFIQEVAETTKEGK